MFARYTHSVNSGAWQIVARSNNSETVVNTAVTVAANQWYLIRCDVNSAGTSANCLIDGVPQTAITTNIPTGTARATGIGSMALKTVGVTTSTTQIDWFAISAYTNR